MKNFILKINRALAAKKKMYLFLAAALCCTTVANARIYKDPLYYEENESTETAYVTYDKDNSENYQGLSTYPYVVVPDYFHYGSPHTVYYNVVGIGEKAFRYSPLKWISLAEGTTYIGNNAFQFCSALEKVEFKAIMGTITNIGDYAFYQCSALKDFKWENVVIQRISPFAFYQCYGLDSVALNDGLLTIGEKAFAHCTGMKMLSLPASTSVIGSMAFQGCTGLQTIYCYAVEPPQIEQNSFLNVTRENITLYVPKGSFLAYRSNGWFGFNIIEMSDEQGIEEPTSDSALKGRGKKLIKDGQLLIERNGKTYNALGAELK